MGGDDGRAWEGHFGVSAVPRGPAADRGGEFRGRCAFAAGQRAAGGAVCVDGLDGVEPGGAALGVLVDRADRGGGVRGRLEHREFYGWDQWHHGVLQPRRAGAPGATERAAEPGRGGSAGGRIHRAVVPDGGGAGRAGVRLVQLPAAREGEVFCGRRRGGGHCLYHAVRPGAADDEDGRRDLAGVPGRLWRGRVLHDRAPDHAA